MQSATQSITKTPVRSSSKSERARYKVAGPTPISPADGDSDSDSDGSCEICEAGRRPIEGRKYGRVSEGDVCMQVLRGVGMVVYTELMCV